MYLFPGKTSHNEEWNGGAIPSTNCWKIPLAGNILASSSKKNSQQKTWSEYALSLGSHRTSIAKPASQPLASVWKLTLCLFTSDSGWRVKSWRAVLSRTSPAKFKKSTGQAQTIFFKLKCWIPWSQVIALFLQLFVDAWILTFLCAVNSWRLVLPTPSTLTVASPTSSRAKCRTPPIGGVSPKLRFDTQNQIDTDGVVRPFISRSLQKITFSLGPEWNCWTLSSCVPLQVKGFQSYRVTLSFCNFHSLPTMCSSRAFVKLWRNVCAANPAHHKAKLQGRSVIYWTPAYRSCITYLYVLSLSRNIYSNWWRVINTIGTYGLTCTKNL